MGNVGGHVQGPERTARLDWGFADGEIETDEQSRDSVIGRCANQ